MRIINFKKKKLKLLTKELHNRIKMQKIVIFVKGKLKIKMIKIKKKNVKLGIMVIIQGNIEVLHIGYLI